MSIRFEAAVKFVKSDTPSLPVQILTDAYNFWRNTVPDKKLSRRTEECMENLVKRPEGPGGHETVQAAEVPADAVEELKAEISSLIKERQVSVYAGCVDFMFDIPLDGERLETLRTAFSDEDIEWDTDEANRCQERIRDFFFGYAGIHPAQAGEDYVLTKDSIAVNFCENKVYYRKHMAEFADAINNLLGGMYITSFVVL